MATSLSEEHVAFQSFEAKNAWGATAAQLAPEELRRALQDACKRHLRGERSELVRKRLGHFAWVQNEAHFQLEWCNFG